MSRKAKQFTLSALIAMALALFGSPDQALASCLMDGSICTSPSECCSVRCEVEDPGDPVGECVPLGGQE